MTLPTYEQWLQAWRIIRRRKGPIIMSNERETEDQEREERGPAPPSAAEQAELLDLMRTLMEFDKAARQEGHSLASLLREWAKRVSGIQL
jgi:hypothetical protein